MEKLRTMYFLKTIKYRIQQSRQLVGCESAFMAQGGRQGLPLGIVHDNIGCSVAFEVPMNPNNVRVVEAGQYPCFIKKAF